jgi:hypothetical protein
LISAEGPRSVSSTIIAKADDRWLAITLRPTLLVSRPQRWRDSYGEHVNTFFESDLLYVRLPVTAASVSAFVLTASTENDKLFGWDARGVVTCSAPAGFSLPKMIAPKTAVDLNPLDYDVIPAANAQILVATQTSAPGSLDCTAPFSDAAVPDPQSPIFPEGAWIKGAVEVIVGVAVGADGTLSDSWVYLSSGDLAIDTAALDAARASTYRAGMAFCRSVPGEYLFQASFKQRP